MSLVASVVDGKVVANTSNSQSSKSTNSGGAMDKNAFLQLLVAQMKYQDPLEPTSNTEYVSQFAQYSQVEELQNMSGSMSLQRATSLIGKTVRIATTSSSGDTNFVAGVVDYVSISNNKAYLSINDVPYSIDDLDTVIDDKYMDKIKDSLENDNNELDT